MRMTLVQSTAAQDRTALVKLLVDAGAKANAPAGENDSTAIQAAARFGGAEMVECHLDLVEYIARPISRDQTCLKRNSLLIDSTPRSSLTTFSAPPRICGARRNICYHMRRWSPPFRRHTEPSSLYSDASREYYQRRLEA